MIRFSEFYRRRVSGSSEGSAERQPAGVRPENQDAVEDLYRRATEMVAESFQELGRHRRIDLDGIKRLSLALAEELARDDRAALRLLLSEYDPHRYLEPHSVNVFLLSVRLARALGVEPEMLAEVGAASLLHDAGMLWVPEEVRDKPGRLSPTEERLIQAHPDRGREAVRESARAPRLVEVVVAQEHEQPDGRGYPRGLSAEEIDPFAGLVRVADFFEAYTHPRAYRPQGFPPSEAVRAVARAAGRAFDPQMAKLLLEELTVYPVGTRVVLSTGETAEVLATNPDQMLNPVVLVTHDPQGNPLPEPRVVNLAEKPGLYIRGIHRREPAGSTL